jgi:hypothetical protein
MAAVAQPATSPTTTPTPPPLAKKFSADWGIDSEDLDFMEATYTPEKMRDELGFTPAHRVRVECEVGLMCPDCVFPLPTPMMKVVVIDTSAEDTAAEEPTAE